MVKDTGGYWTLTTDSISEGFHYYSLMIDGVAVADPASETFYGMGRMASGIEIPDKDMAFYQSKMYLMDRFVWLIIFQTSLKPGGGPMFIHRLTMIIILTKNILCYTFYMVEEKTKQVGQRKAGWIS